MMAYKGYKIKTAQVIRIKKMQAEGLGCAVISERTGISRGAIRRFLKMEIIDAEIIKKSCPS
jgi:hypothetical protein